MLSLRQKVAHENIVEILLHGSLGQHTASYFIDMEYCDINLDEYIYGKKTSILHLQDYAASIEDKSISFSICALIQQILSGLVFIHRLNKVHRDLKPQNSILLSLSTDVQYYTHRNRDGGKSRISVSPATERQSNSKLLAVEEEHLVIAPQKSSAKALDLARNPIYGH